MVTGTLISIDYNQQTTLLTWKISIFIQLFHSSQAFLFFLNFSILLSPFHSSNKKPNPIHSKVIQLILDGQLLLFNPPPLCPSIILTIMSKCWRTDPSKRIKFATILSELANYCTAEQKQLLLSTSELPQSSCSPGEDKNWNKQTIFVTRERCFAVFLESSRQSLSSNRVRRWAFTRCKKVFWPDGARTVNRMLKVG